MTDKYEVEGGTVGNVRFMTSPTGVAYDSEGNVIEPIKCLCGEPSSVYLSGRAASIWLCIKCAYGEKGTDGRTIH